MTGVFLTIFTLFWTCLVLMFDGLTVRDTYQQLEARHFLATTGTMTHSKLTSSHSSKGGTSYSAKLEYQYEVGGQTFTGNKIRSGMNSSSQGSASSIVDAHPVGSTVQIFYNPADPGESLLEPGVNGSDLMGFIFLTPFNMIMLGLWIWIGGWLREHWFKPLAGGVKIITDGAVTRIRLPQFPAFGWGMAVTGGLGFFSVFIVGFTTNMEPSLTVAVGVLTAVYGAGLAVFLWQWQKINSGIDDLVLNEASRTVELPLTFGRKERRTVNISDITGLSVQQIEHRNNKGGVSYTFAPTLKLGRPDRFYQKLADWSDEMKAYAFTDWLRQKLNPHLPATPAVDLTEDENEAEDLADAAAAEREYEELRRNGKSRIKISDGSAGREFYFPPARNLGTAFGLTGFFIIWSGVVWFMLHAPPIFPIVFGSVDAVLLVICFNLWFKSTRVTVNPGNVQLQKRWLLFRRTRDFSTRDYVCFATKMGMQSGSRFFTDIRLVRAGADGELAQDLKRFPEGQQVNQLVAERFRRAAGPSGITVAGSIANSAEAEWLVKEMNRALGRGQPRYAKS